MSDQPDVSSVEEAVPDDVTVEDRDDSEVGEDA